METEYKILRKASEMFMTYGIKSVTMDDISRAIGISKKTLYQYVDNKLDLLKKTIFLQNEEEKNALANCKQQSSNAIEEVILISRYVNQLLQNINPAAVYDLQKYYIEHWNLMRSLHEEYIFNMIRENLKNGIDQGFYRKDMNIDIVAKLFGATADIILDTNLFPIQEYKRSDLHREMVRYHLHSIVSDKGHNILEEFYKNEE
jgi:TetR/AcrR family transcriptional regulator, cholesterol catabolism regulator